MNTKERILEASLTLFATKGYGEVYVGEIADAVGIKAPSLYKHFRNKQQIFDALIEDMTTRYAERARKIGIDGADAREDAGLFAHISEDALVGIGRELFLYFLHDPHMSRFRRVLTLEQFKNPALGRLYTRQYYEDPIAYQSGLFRLMAEAGRFSDEDPELMAVEFYAPIYAMLTVCDRDPSFEADALRLIEAHIRRFNGHFGGNS